LITTSQIESLCKIANLVPFKKDNTVLYIIGTAANYNISFPYDLFKKEMGLDDIRLHWLTTKDAFLAGGSVLNWILSENQNEDIDFFFSDRDAETRFELFVKSYFTYCRETGCAKTYMNENTILQLVGSMHSPVHFFGRPLDVISRFDIGLCKFAVDNDTVYTTYFSVRDLISKSLHYNKDNRIKYLTESSVQRLFKYSRKGFYNSDENTGRV